MVQVKFQYIGETKRTYKYVELESHENTDELVGTLYVKKTTFPAGAPKYLAMTLTELEKVT